MATIPHKIGATLRMKCTWKTGGTPVDLTGVTLSCSIKAKKEAHTLQATLTDPVNGLFELYASAADTATWKAGQYHCDIKATFPSGDVVLTETFTLDVDAPVTI